MQPTMRSCLVALAAAPLAFVAIAVAAPAAEAGGYSRDSATFSITIGGYGNRGPAFRYGSGIHRAPAYAPRSHAGPGRRFGPRRHDGRRRHAHARSHYNNYGYRSAPRARRYGRAGVGYGCFGEFRHGYRVTVCRNAQGAPFIVSRY